MDEYNKLIGWGDQVHVEVWIVQDGQTCETATALHETAIIQSDDSVTCNDNVDGQGVDVYNAGTDNVLQPLGITLYVGPQGKPLSSLPLR